MNSLIIKQPWIALILNNQKTWEMRSRMTHVRGRIGLIQSGSGLVVGEATLVDCFSIINAQTGKCEAPNLCEMRHRISDQALLAKYPFAWVLSDPVRYTKPKPYQHPKGAVVWVKIDV